MLLSSLSESQLGTETSLIKKRDLYTIYLVDLFQFDFSGLKNRSININQIETKTKFRHEISFDNALYYYY
jgi:hypothetical protein